MLLGQLHHLLFDVKVSALHGGHSLNKVSAAKYSVLTYNVADKLCQEGMFSFAHFQERLII